MNQPTNQPGSKPFDGQNPFDENAAPAQEVYPVEVDGQTVPLTLEQLIEAAAAGLSKRSQAARMGRAAGQVPSGQIYAEFLAEYPDVRPQEIPEEVWRDAQEQGSLLAAYRKWENAQLKARLEALEQNDRNRRAAVGPAAGEGEPAYTDPVAAALLA